MLPLWITYRVGASRSGAFCWSISEEIGFWEPASKAIFSIPIVGGMAIHAHDFLLQFLGEWGVPGAGIAFDLLFRAFRCGLKTHSHLSDGEKRIHTASGLALLALIVTGFFGGIFYFVQPCAYLALFFAV